MVRSDEAHARQEEKSVEGGRAMNCPECTSDNCMVINSRMKGLYKRNRRYECMDCKNRFTTVEILVGEYQLMRDAAKKEKVIRKVYAKLSELFALIKSEDG